MKNARQMPQRKFRFPEELIALIEQAADENHRSANAEVVYRLEQSFKGGRNGQQ
ncbi:Arc family DNA-binding protein [Serratia sp. JSRIV002]|uniref:Arc family DNA-binding protein n=1 Tax=Serratia sp. JSRIV002 TaxID=2831894 RepID=UPI001CBCF192|nr:Arc family DNA-binding protein [Serratia sp. JSRIV002]UAN53473.1 Arc family DNA-binding protein [Serratia sp. JSRIV002]